MTGRMSQRFSSPTKDGLPSKNGGNSVTEGM